jgi:hypothetical protein
VYGAVALSSSIHTIHEQGCSICFLASHSCRFRVSVVKCCTLLTVCQTIVCLCAAHRLVHSIQQPCSQLDCCDSVVSMHVSRRIASSMFTHAASPLAYPISMDPASCETLYLGEKLVHFSHLSLQESARPSRLALEHYLFSSVSVNKVLCHVLRLCWCHAR